MKVHTTIAGSHCAVQLNPRNWERYIDARKDSRYPRLLVH